MKMRKSVPTLLKGVMGSAAGLVLCSLSTPAWSTPSLLDFSSGGSLSGWTTDGTITTTNVTVNLTLGGNAFALTPANGAYMASINPQGSSVMLSSADAALGLTAGTLNSVLATNTGSGTASATNFGILTKSKTLAAGTYSFSWSYAAQDYQPYNDGVLFSISGNGLNTVTVLADNGSTKPQAGTNMVGSYGSTAWATTSFTIATSGVYQLGLAAYNWLDTGLNPILYVSDTSGSLTKNGAPLVGATPDIDTAQGYYLVSNLGSTVNPAFTGGTLKVDSSGSVSQSLTINNSGGTIDSAGNTSTFSGVLSNASAATGSLTVIDSVGGGLLILNGVNTYTGTTTVSGGTLEVGDMTHFSASLAGDVVVSSGGTLRGHGTIGGNLNNNGGTMAPGGSIGTTTVSGNYVQSSNGTLSIELNPTTTSKLVVSGTATLAGTLSLTPDSGTYVRGTTYQILTAGSGVSGTFSTVANTAPSIAGFSVLYAANEVDLTATTGTTSFVSNARSTDQRNIALALDTVSPSVTSGAMNTLLNALTLLPASSQPQALDQLTNHVVTQTQSSGSLRLLTGSLVNRATNMSGVTNPLLVGENGPALQEVKLADATGGSVASDAPSNIPLFSEGMTAWMQGIGAFSSIGGTDVAPGVTSSTGGFSTGLEQHIDAETHVGVMFGLTRGGVGINTVGQSGTMDSYGLGVYGSEDVDDVTFDGSLIGSYNHATSKRNIAFLGEVAQGASDGFGLGIDTGISQRYALTDDTTLLPRVGFDYTYTQQNGFTETGAPSSNLQIGAQAQNLLQSDVGATLASRFELADDEDTEPADVLLPQMHLGWLHEWISPAAQVQENFSGITSPSFTTYGANPGRDAAVVAVGLGYILGQSKDMTLYLNYGATVGANETSHAINGGVKINW